MGIAPLKKAVSLVSTLGPLALLIILFASVITRLYITINHDLDIDLHVSHLTPFTPYDISTKPTHVLCLLIWLTMGYLSWSLSKSIKKTKVIGSRDLRGKESSYHYLGLVCVIGYEILMFCFIYAVYASVFNIVVQLLMLIPLITLVFHSYHQMVFVVSRYPVEETNFYRCSLFFNFIMIVHVIIMGVTSYYKYYTGSISINSEHVIIDVILKLAVVFLGIIEFIYRCLVICCYIRVRHGDRSKPTQSQDHGQAFKKIVVKPNSHETISPPYHHQPIHDV